MHETVIFFVYCVSNTKESSQTKYCVHEAIYRDFYYVIKVVSKKR
jgi:hypothetical protein